MTVSIELGAAKSGDGAVVDLEELLATRLLVQGNSGSGKSHLLRRLMEQSAPYVQQVVVDPEGDFVGLSEAFGHLVIDAAAYTEDALARSADKVRQHRVSVVLNLEGLDVDAQMRSAAAFLNGLFDADRDYWFPVLVIVDEAQLFAPATAGDVADEARKLSLGAMTNLMCRGRKRGLAGVIATQRLAKLAKNVAAEASNFLMGRTFLDIDMARAADLLGMERRQAEMFRDLARGCFIALGPALYKRPLQVRIGEVTTAGRGGTPKLVPLSRTDPAEARNLVMAATAMDAPMPVRRAAPAPAAPDILSQLARGAPVAPSGPRRAGGGERVIGPELEAALRQVLGESDSAFRSVAVLYQDFLAHCRARGVRGEVLDMAGFRGRLAESRADLGGEMAGNAVWAEARQIAAGLEEDIQGVFLLLARSAIVGAPCPADTTIARIYGSASLSRARRVLNYLSERGVVEVIPAGAGWRMVEILKLGVTTAAGDQNAADLALVS